MSPLGFSDGDVIKGSFFIKNEDHTVNNKHDLYDYNGNLTLQNIVISGNNCTVEEDIPGREYTLVINDNEVHRVDFEAVINDVGTLCNVFLYNYERGGNSTGFGRYVTGVVIGHEASQPIPATTWHVEREADIPKLPAGLTNSHRQTWFASVNTGDLLKGNNYIMKVEDGSARLQVVKSSDDKYSIRVYDFNGYGDSWIIASYLSSQNNGILSITVVVDGTRLKVYQDGVLVKEVARLNVGFGNSGEPVNIGYYHSSHQLSVFLRHFLIKNVAKSDVEVLELHDFLRDN
jgi:hypothetical protein